MNQHLSILRPREYLVEYELFDDIEATSTHGLESVVASSEEDAVEKMQYEWSFSESETRMSIVRVYLAAGFRFGHDDLMP